MTEPTTQELIDWLDNEAVVRMYRKDRDMAHAIAERLRAMQWRPMSEAPRDGGAILARLGIGGRPVVVHWESPMWIDSHEVYWPNLGEWCRIPPPEGER